MDHDVVIVGAGPYLEKAYDQARHLGLSGDVIFTGFVSDTDLPKYYAAADVFAIASKFETQGIVVLEALASGRPVAGANFRAIPEFVRDGVNGALFDPSSPRACADEARERRKLTTSQRSSSPSFSAKPGMPPLGMPWVSHQKMSPAVCWRRSPRWPKTKPSA